MKKLLPLLLLISFTSCDNPQNKCERDKEKALQDIGAEIYYIEHHPDERLVTEDDSAVLNWHKQNYEMIFLFNCPQEK